MSSPPALPPAPARAAAVRMFGRLQLMRLLGKSERTMAWRAYDPGAGRELALVLPRLQPADAPALQRWQEGLKRAARLSHPQLAPVLELGVQDGWPYAAYDAQDFATLGERLSAQSMPGGEAAGLTLQLLRGLAYAHEAGVAHHDLQTFLVLVADNGALRLGGLAVGAEASLLQMAAATDPAGLGAVGRPAELNAAQVQRAAAERDVLASGLLLHTLLAGQPALEEADTGRAIARLPPLGREFVRLPWTLTQPLAEPLRAIVNRATERQERQRYRSARTLLQALEGWLQTDDGSGRGPLGLLTEKIRVAGVLPSSPGAAARAARLAMMERGRTSELAEVVLEDPALSFEMLRLVNSAQVRGAQVSGSGPVLTVRRAIAMLGLDRLRGAALAMRPWPGPLAEPAAEELRRLIERCKRAAHTALALRPAGYDGEVVYLITLMQNLGRLVVAYHLPEEAVQVRRLMQPAPPARAGEPEEAGMSEEAACFAVIGADADLIAAAVARQWGLDDAVLALIRKLPLATAVRPPEDDDEVLRAVASCANEAVDALALPTVRVLPALQRVVHRYGRALAVDLRGLQAALQPVTQTVVAPTAPGALDEAPVGTGSAARLTGRLRAAAPARAGR